MKKEDAGLILGAAALAPLVAFAALWTTLLAMIGVSGLLHWLGLW
jgi:hypothetical protein